MTVNLISLPARTARRSKINVWTLSSLLSGAAILVFALPRSSIVYPIWFLLPFAVFPLRWFFRSATLTPAGIAFLVLIPVNLTAALLSSAHILSVAIAFVTLSPIVCLMVAPAVSQDDQRIALTALLLLYTIEVVIALIQVLTAPSSISHNPDIAQGTFGAGGPRIVAIYTVAACSYFMLVWRGSFRLLYATLFVVAFALTMSVAIAGAALAALIGTAIVTFVPAHRRAPEAKGRRAAVVGAVLLLVSAAFSVAYVERTRIADVLGKVWDTPRVKITAEVLAGLGKEAPWQPLIGLGAGQFASWASAICDPKYRAAKLTGKHLTSTGAMDCSNAIAKRWIFVTFYSELNVYAESIVGHPLYSLLTWYTEWGVLGLAWFAYAVFNLQTRLRRIYRKQRSRLAIWAQFNLWFFVALGVLDVVVEYPHVAYPLLLPALLCLAKTDQGRAP